MLLKPSEVEYIVPEGFLDNLFALKNHDINDSDETVIGKTLLIGGNNEPIYLEEELAFLPDFRALQEQEMELVLGPSITIGGNFDDLEYQISDIYADDEIPNYRLNESLHNLDTEYDLELGDNFYSNYKDSDEEKTRKYIDEEYLDSDWEKTKHTSLMGRVDNKLLGKIREYRKNIQEMSDEKLLGLSPEESRERLLEEAALIAEEFEDTSGGNINQLIVELDKKISVIVKKYTEQQVKDLKDGRETMLKEVERDVEDIILNQIDVFKKEAEEHIDETIHYYKKKLESDNHTLSSANNIISRREQILDEAYSKSLLIIEDSEEKARAIIQGAANVQSEAELIIAQFEQKGEEIQQEAEIESERIISDSNIEAARIIQAAEDQHQDIVEAATQDGFSVGYQEGREEALKENAELLKEATNALNKLHAAFPVAVMQNEDKLVKIAYQISQSVLGEEVAEKPDLCEKAMKIALRKVSDFEPVKIKVNPSDLDAILPKQEYFKSIIPDVQEFIITGDNNVTKGLCVINTVSETVNISLNTQLSILEAVFNMSMAEYEADY